LLLLTEDSILCDADYDSESDDDEDLDGEPLDGDSESEDFDDEDLDGEPLDVHPYFTRDIPWNRDAQVLHMPGDDALDRDDDIWEQPPLFFIMFPLRQTLCRGLNPKKSWTACTTLVRHTLELRINRCSLNSRWPLVPFHLRKWEL